ncbi:helix-turn-helix domain-containing protein [Micromonospora carbonacea]|uniref:Helix-turn-helix domain-containing protein n=1 Tax=Micromonospora carbonacea TaxID=47853 RepID=A0A7H8XI68_9ACTN|nr:helix-turn-helix domain-containing protein [Micromonospora carbonacea]MBB5828157.1 hypothetical protein [Micromonospora carbonacea]QLD24198.1 helix-turn-helix domain-containing protein [Micromonospora carbonacea]
MSRAVKAALSASQDLPKTERLVLVAIAAHANADGNAWPAVATIAEYVGCSVRTVQRCVAKLVQLGRLVVSKAAHVVTRVYRLVTGEPVTPRAAGVPDPAAVVPDPPTDGDTQGVSPEVEDPQKLKGRAAARWFARRGKNTNPGRPPFPERRGAALPVADRAGQCPRHRGCPAGNCGPCRSEALGGDR